MSEEEKAALAAKEAEETTQKIAELEKEKEGLVGELQEDRKARQGLKEEIELLQTQLKASVEAATANPEDAKIQDVVEKTLAAKDASRAKNNKVIALEKFITENKEFHPDNDAGGVRRAALEEKLARFSTEGMTEIEDFTNVIVDAEALLGRTDTTPKTPTETEVANPYSSTSKSTITPTVAIDKDLDPREQKLIEQAGFTKERYLELKAKMPDYINGLLKNVE